MDNEHNEFYKVVDSNFNKLNFEEKKEELEKVYDVVIFPTKDVFNILSGNIKKYMKNLKKEIRINGAYIHLFWKKQRDIAKEKIKEYLENYKDDALSELKLMATYVKLKKFTVNCNLVYNKVINFLNANDGLTTMYCYYYNIIDKKKKIYLSIQEFCEEHKVCIPESEFHNKDILNILNGKYLNYILKPKYYKYLALYYMFSADKSMNTNQIVSDYLSMAEKFKDKYASLYRYYYNRYILKKYEELDEPTELLEKIYYDDNIDDVLYELAEIQFDWYGGDDKCIKYLEKGIEKNNIFCINLLAEIYESNGKIKEAKKYMQMALKRGFSRNINLLAMKLNVDEEDIANCIKWYLNKTNNIMFFDYVQHPYLCLYGEITISKLKKIENLVNDNRFVINWKKFEKYGN